MIPIIFVLALNLMSPVQGTGPSIVIDNRPEAGVPQEASAQLDRTPGQKQPKSLSEITNGTIKSVRIRYFNKDAFATEDKAREYIRGFLAHKSQPVFGFQVWSEMVGVPEFECIIAFTDDYREKLREEHKSCRDGRLLIWRTEACFRDATGRWWFVSAFDYFHRAHPEGDLKLVNRELSR